MGLLRWRAQAYQAKALPLRLRYLSVRSKLQFRLSRWIKTIEACRAVRAFHLLGTSIFEDTSRKNLLAKIALVEPFVKDDFIDSLQLAQRKLHRQQAKGNRGIAKFAP